MRTVYTDKIIAIINVVIITDTKAAPNYVAIVVPSVVGILVVVSVVSAVIVGIFISLRRRNLKKECGIRPTVYVTLSVNY